MQSDHGHLTIKVPWHAEDYRLYLSSREGGIAQDDTITQMHGAMWLQLNTACRWMSMTGLSGLQHTLMLSIEHILAHSHTHHMSSRLGWHWKCSNPSSRSDITLAAEKQLPMAAQGISIRIEATEGGCAWRKCNVHPAEHQVRNQVPNSCFLPDDLELQLCRAGSNAHVAGSHASGWCCCC